MDTAKILDAPKKKTEGVQCAPLMEAASFDLYKGNGFRITGLTVDSTAKEVTKRGDKLKLMEELGQGAGANTNAFPLNPPPSVDTIREALQRLKDPESRLIDEFFWFWPQGTSGSDAAIQAYITGDGEKAFDLWYFRRGEPDQSAIAYHNLAVVNHLMAIEWSSHFIDRSPDDDTQEKISAYWSTAIRYWRKVGDNDDAWDFLKERIRVIDDPRLTTGLARRIRTLLPEAIAKINAAFALALAERGQTTATQAHIKYAYDIGLDDDAREEVFLQVLQPARDRYSSQVKDLAKRNQDPKQLFATAKTVLNQTPAMSHILETFFGASSHHRTELLDEAMVACAIAGTLYQKATGDLEGFLAAAKQALPYSTSTEARKRVQDNIDFGERQLRQKAYEPFLEDLKQILAAKHSPILKLASIKEEIMPRLATMVRDSGPHSKEAQYLQDEVAGSVRSIGIDAHNEHNDFATAQEAARLASKLARDPELKKRLADDQKQLEKNEAEEIKSRVDLTLRGDFIFSGRDHVQINRQFVTYNKMRVPVAEINGIRFGIFREYRNGMQSRCSYKIGIHSFRNTVINIECKRTFVSESQAKTDYEAILNSVFVNIIPNVALGCARSIVSQGFKLGESTMTADGMTLSNNHIFGRKDVFVPYSQIRYGFNQGVLTVVKDGETKVNRAFVVRDVWNAIIFEQLLKAISIVKTQK
jgi:hypothetical protein